MDNNLNVVQCPQCGSGNHSVLKEGIFKCDNCSSVYFKKMGAESNRKEQNSIQQTIQINVNTQPQGTQRNQPVSSLRGTQHNQPVPPQNEKPFGCLKLLAVVILIPTGLILFIYMILNLLGGLVEDLDKQRNDYKYQTLMKLDDKGYVLDMGLKHRNKKDVFSYSILDINQDSVVLTQTVEDYRILGDYMAQVRQFRDGNYYVIVGYDSLYLFDLQAKTPLTNITKATFKDISILESGIISFRFMDAPYGDGYEIINYEGDTVNYYPIVNKVYTSDNFMSNAKGLNSVLGGSRDSIYYTTTEDNKQLLKVIYKTNNGGPEFHEGKFVGKDDYNNYRITSSLNITPKQKYDYIHLLYYDNNRILIYYELADAYFLRELDAKKNKAVWTKRLTSKQTFSEIIPKHSFFIEGDKYILVNTDNANEPYIIISQKGEEISKYKPNMENKK